MPPDNLNRLLQDYAARIEKLTKRVDRLETLEFTSAAFPGGACGFIEDFLLTIDTASITFGTALAGGIIPATFKHLWIWANPILPDGDAADQMLMRFNGDSAGNYSRYKFISFNDLTTMASFTTSDSGDDTATYIDVGEIGSFDGAGIVFSGHEINIYDYANATKRKTASFKCWQQRNIGGESPSVTAQTELGGGSWADTDAIEIITLAPLSGGDFRAGSRFTLYGKC